MIGVVDCAQPVILSHAPVTDAHYRLDDFDQQNVPHIPAQQLLQAPMLKTMSQCSLCALQELWSTTEPCCVLCVFNRPKAALYHRDKLIMPRSVLAHLTVTLFLKLNVSEQLCTVQRFGLTLTRIRAMDSLCADLFSLYSGL